MTAASSSTQHSRKALTRGSRRRELIRDGQCHLQAKRGHPEGSAQLPRPVSLQDTYWHRASNWFTPQNETAPSPSDVKPIAGISFRRAGTSPSKGAAKGEMSFRQEAAQKACLQLSQAIKQGKEFSSRVEDPGRAATFVGKLQYSADSRSKGRTGSKPDQ